MSYDEENDDLMGMSSDIDLDDPLIDDLGDLNFGDDNEDDNFDKDH
ncbi:hypothetical protein K8Q94_03480 [Candidatus Nomurabacteria bacterium]|nr:hypothetical protein [Candidatus Nomurabacteria bacterium]